MVWQDDDAVRVPTSALFRGPEGDWAVFVGPDGSAQVRDCGDVEEFGLPRCEIKGEEGPGESST